MLLVGAFMAGWFKINRDGERTTIEINRTEIRGDTRKAIDRGREFLDRHEQQYDDQQYAEQGQQTWPQERVATQQDAWGTNFDYQQQPNYNYQTQPYQGQTQDQRYPAQAIDPRQQYQQQQYYPEAN